ncbi:MAG: hypothetical protein V2A72_01085 [Candidatus Omnitrophota bacterium]
MKKAYNIIIISAALLSVALTSPGYCASKRNLYNKFCGQKQVNVFVQDFVNATGENKVDVKDLQQKLKDALDARKSINFTVVNSKEEADIVITCDVTKFQWLENDPVDMVYGVGPIAYDLLTDDNYAQLDTKFSVTDAKKNRLLWKDDVTVYITRKDMDEQASAPIVNEKCVKTFIRECFGK